MLVSNLQVYLHSMQIKNKNIMYMYLGDVESLVLVDFDWFSKILAWLPFTCFLKFEVFPEDFNVLEHILHVAEYLLLSFQNTSTLNSFLWYQKWNKSHISRINWIVENIAYTHGKQRNNDSRPRFDGRCRVLTAWDNRNGKWWGWVRMSDIQWELCF